MYAKENYKIIEKGKLKNLSYFLSLICQQDQVIYLIKQVNKSVFQVPEFFKTKTDIYYFKVHPLFPRKLNLFIKE